MRSAVVEGSGTAVMLAPPLSEIVLPPPMTSPVTSPGDNWISRNGARRMPLN